MEDDTELFAIEEDDMGDCFDFSLVGQADVVRTPSSLIGGGDSLGSPSPLAQAKPRPVIPAPKQQQQQQSPLPKAQPRQPLQQLQPQQAAPPSPKRPPPSPAKARGSSTAGASPGGWRPLNAAGPPGQAQARKAAAASPTRRAAASPALRRPSPTPRTPTSQVDVSAAERSRKRSSPQQGLEPQAKRVAAAAAAEYELAQHGAHADEREEFMCDFRSGPWMAMLHAADLPPFDGQDPTFRMTGSIRMLKRQGACARVRSLVVMVKKIELGDENHSVLLKDPTGAIQGCLHASVADSCPGMVGEGSVLVLARPLMIYASAFQQLLSITNKSIVRIFPPHERIPAAYAALSAAERAFDPASAYMQAAPRSPGPVRPAAGGTPRTRTPRSRRLDSTPYRDDSQLTSTAPLPRGTGAAAAADKDDLDDDDLGDDLDALLADIPEEELNGRPAGAGH